MIVKLNERRQWQFINGQWGPDSDGSFRYPGDLLDDDEEALQGCRMAFCSDAAWRDFDAELVVTQSAFTDTGLIFAATDPAHFFMVHFPDVGQASRARHFWVALSEMSGDGLLRLLKLECVRRVTPYPYGVPHNIEIQVRERDLRACINGVGVFEARGLLPARTGLVGLWSFRDPRYVRASINGDPAEGFKWDPSPRLQKNWFHPVPTDRRCWQMPIGLLRLPSGELVLNYGVQGNRDQSEGSNADPFLVRSRDGGRTWSEPQPLRLSTESRSWAQPRLHHTPAGRLVAFTYDPDVGRYLTSESDDDARTWSSPTFCELPASAPRVAKLVLGPQPPINLSNGSILAFLNGADELASRELSVMSWGALHCQAFATTSQDDGRTWSAPTPIDGLQNDPSRKPHDGNMDLTEVCGVETTTGRVIALVRPIYSPMMWETTSFDFGQTWQPCAVGPFAGYATPNMLRTANGTILVAHRLPGLTINASRDDGQTWDQGTMIDSGLWCMGSMLEVEPNRVLYVYWDSFMQLMRAQFFEASDTGLQPGVR